MIDLNALATAINDMLGEKDFAVYLNSNAYPDDKLGKTVVTMNVVRVPFGFSTEEFDAESLTITLTFDLECDVRYGADKAQDEALAIIQKEILGHKKTTVMVDEENGVSYKVDMFFEQQPAGQPYVDNGRITQQIIVSGKALVKINTCGAVVGNDIMISIDGTQLLKLSRASSLQVGMDNNLPLSQGETLTEAKGISRTATNTLTFIYTGKAIEDEFLKIAEGCEHNVNKVYTVLIKYPNFTVEKLVKIVNVTTQDSVGVYLQYTLTVQTVANTEE